MGDTFIIHDDDSNELAEKLSKEAGFKKANYNRTIYPDGETKVRLSEDITESDVILIKRMYPEINRNIVELMMLVENLDSKHNAIHLILPYLPYARQDKEFLHGEIISIKSLLNVLSHFNVKSVITFDMHSIAIKSMSKINITNVSAIKPLAKYIKEAFKLANPMVISPDKGAEERAKSFASILGCSYVVLEKNRNRETGEVVTKRKDIGAINFEAIIVDDMVSTGGSMANAAAIAKQNGASKVFAVFTHALLINDAAKKLYSAGVDYIISSNTIINDYQKVDIAEEIADAIGLESSTHIKNVILQ